MNLRQTVPYLNIHTFFLYEPHTLLIPQYKLELM